MGKIDRYRNNTAKLNEMEMNKQQQNIWFLRLIKLTTNTEVKQR